jgi:hypothetical protein
MAAKQPALAQIKRKSFKVNQLSFDPSFVSNHLDHLDYTILRKF